MSTLSQITVTIGRNIGDSYLSKELGEGTADAVRNGTVPWPELSDHEWLALRGYVRDALGRTVGPVVFQYGSHDGSWAGAAEESVLLVVLAETDPEVNRKALLRGELLKIAINFRQDAIALSFGRSELVESEPVH